MHNIKEDVGFSPTLYLLIIENVSVHYEPVVVYDIKEEVGFSPDAIFTHYRKRFSSLRASSSAQY